MISSVISSTCTQYAIINDTYQMLLCLSFSTGAVDPAAPAFFILPRGLGGPSDCQAATVAARSGVAAFKSWHLTCKSIFICSRIHRLHKGAFATSWLFEVPPGARSGTICMVTSSSCWLDAHVGYHRGQFVCLFLLVPAWLAIRGNLHSDAFHTLSMLQLLWRSSIAIRVQS